MTNSDRYPRDLLYHPEHDWVRVQEDVATFGVTWYAQDALGEIVHWDPPTEGTQVRKDEPYAELESVKAVSDVIAPLSGTVIAINDALTNEPGLINEDPHGEGWLVRVRIASNSELESLLAVDDYVGLLS